MYRLAVFDIDGTLIDTERTGVESLVMTIRELLGKEVPYGEAYKAFGIHIVCSEDTVRHKPHPEPLLHCVGLASKALGIPIRPDEVVFFGDTDHDFACARDAGCDFALADWKNRGWQNIPARYKFSDAKEMEAVLFGS